ncbi:hypothetical protein Daesc_009625 [Daldinia eschscholtzii]|uniref:Uncharacterized protein n=1 Tax=Daldinia eschscholtzii TaxID=292717 RepID=A0AAX6MBH0_9PEZI
MSLLREKYAALLNPEVLRAHQKPILLATGITAAATPLLAYAWSCYRQWLALGPGGVPYHFFGWLLQTSMHVIARTDIREPVPRPYKRVEDVAALYGDAGAQSFFARDGDGDGGASTLPPRKGRRPEIPSFVAPQRQLSEQAPPPTVAAEKAFLDALAAANPTLFEARASKLEGPLHRALWLRMPSDPDKKKLLQTRLGRGADGEFAHVHGEGELAPNPQPRGREERHRGRVGREA